jgi:hypothetical protein
MIISHSKKFIFFKPLKVAGSSVEACLAKHCGEEDVLTGSDIDYERQQFDYVSRNNFDERGKPIFHMHTSPQLLYSMTDNTWDDYFKFTIVRNPWEMTVSYFWWCFYSPTNSVISKCYDASEDSINEFSTITPSEEDSADALRTKFEQFIEAVGHFNTGPRGDEGFHRVIDWLSRSTCEFYDNADTIIRYETLQEDYEKLCGVISLPKEMLPHLKANQRKSKIHYTDYYSDWSKIQVKMAFRDVISRFGYSFAT